MDVEIRVLVQGATARYADLLAAHLRRQVGDGLVRDALGSPVREMPSFMIEGAFAIRWMQCSSWSLSRSIVPRGRPSTLFGNGLETAGPGSARSDAVVPMPEAVPLRAVAGRRV